MIFCCCIPKERLKRNVGGNHWKIAIFLEESGNLKCIRYENVRWLGNVADALDITIINLKEGGSFEELGDGLRYQRF